MKAKSLTVLCLAFLILAACGKKDADLQNAVVVKLAADNVTGVTVAVKDGVATLTGEVADITVKNKATASAKAGDGQHYAQGITDARSGSCRPDAERQS
jgi:uncharacterized lipoprotein YajG